MPTDNLSSFSSARTFQKVDYLQELAKEKERRFGRMIKVSCVAHISYIIIYLILGGYLSAISLAVSFFIGIPITLCLSRMGYATSARLFTILTSNMMIFGCSVGVLHQGGVQYYFSPLAALPLILFDIGDWKRMGICMLLPLFCWFLSLGGLPSNFAAGWTMHPSYFAFMRSANFFGSFVVMMGFFSVFIRSMISLRDYGVMAANAHLEELVATRNQIENFFIVSPDLICVMSTHGLLVRSNPAFEKVLGYALNEMEEKPMIMFVHESDAIHYRLAMNSLLNGAQKINFECRMLCRDGSYRLINWSWSLDSGYFYASGRDITDARRIEIDLKQTMQAIDQSTLVLITSKDGSIRSANDSFCSLSGYSREELIGKDYRFLTSREHTKEFFVDLWTTIASGKIWSGEIENKKKDGQSYWMQSCIGPLLNEHNEIDRYISISIDVTQKKNAEMQLVQSTKMSSLGEMAGGIAHEINSPLAIIIGKSSNLRTLADLGKLDPARLHRELEKIEATGFRIAKIIKGLRAFSRNSDNDPMVSENIKQVIEDTLDLCREQFKSQNIPLMLNIDETISIDCRSAQISQIILNLLHNSLGAVASLTEKWVAIEVLRSGDFAEIRITDSGKGIPREIEEKIMQPFFTTKEIGEGTGLGLSVSKGMAEEHQGELFYDRSCANTRFIVRIPFVQKEKLVA